MPLGRVDRARRQGKRQEESSFFGKKEAKKRLSHDARLSIEPTANG
jgi:hypothetical protein